MIVVPVFHMVLTPDSRIYFQTDLFRQQAGRAVQGEKLILLPQKIQKRREDLTDADFYPVGVIGRIEEIHSEGFLTVRTENRVDITEVCVNSDHSIELTMKHRPSVRDLDPAEAEEKLSAVKNEMFSFVKEFQWGSMAKPILEVTESLGEIASMLSIWLTISEDERYAVLAEDSERKRSELLEKIVIEYLEVARVTNDAANAQQKEYQGMYREAAIKKQMEYLQKELDEMHPEKVTDLRKFEMKIEEAGMNQTAREEAEKVLNRLKQEGNNSPEAGMLYDYLDFVTGLSWKTGDPGHINIADASRILDADHYGLKKAKKRIIQQIAVMNLKQKQSGSILLFVGAPGTGKTSIGKSIAKALGREYVRVSLGGVHDEADIRGHRRTYIGAMPGRIMDGIRKSGVSNPVMVLDEVDKVGSSYHGDPASALLEVLDPEQNSTFTDHYMNVPYDLSNVLFICTANTVDTIPEPLLNRMEVIRFGSYTDEEKLSIAKEHLLPKAMEQAGIPEDRLVVSDEVIRRVISDYTREAGVRGLRKRMDSICRGAAVELSEDPEITVRITEEMLREELDMTPARRSVILKKAKPGVVTGMAWTSAGGDILYIEALGTKGSGTIQVTGQLGEVMKESVQIAVSLVKSMLPEKARFFREHDLHVHVPDGAVPKDGPSAGITMTTAIASLVSGNPVDTDIAMTGEVSLRGAVTPIGGLPEKLTAAVTAGVKKVFIPEDNMRDLKDVPEEVKGSLTIIPVTEVRQVLRETGILKKTKLQEAG